MTKSTAKKFVNSMNNGRSEPEYTLESWERIGHTRTLKSGKVIYIEPTTCHRHLPLTESERKVYVTL